MNHDDEGPSLAAPQVEVGPDGRLSVPAEQVTALLRSVAEVWRAGAREGVPVLDVEDGTQVSLEPVTVRALADSLRGIADELDVQFIDIAGRTRPDADDPGGANGRGSSES
ncbi:hypothetical protein ACFV3R_26030 [Streptomyces sp. NPDC059740]|uniref:hypothetical protein n=1 Tax=Streptomyces sp. NPDC059740 TaxID=3346926 RepID=UPI003668FCE0